LNLLKLKDMESPIRTPPRLGKRYNKFSPLKSNFIDKLIRRSGRQTIGKKRSHNLKIVFFIKLFHV
jgi:hypothetical protein